jgi:hypothetical protein
MPPDPRPAMVLPRMKATEFGAAPQRAEPVSNSRMDVRKVALMLKKVYSFPNTSWKAQLVSRYAVPYQPISPAELNSLVIWGMAVEIIRRSCKRGWSVCSSVLLRSMQIKVGRRRSANAPGTPGTC